MDEIEGLVKLPNLEDFDLANLNNLKFLKIGDNVKEIEKLDLSMY